MPASAASNHPSRPEDLIGRLNSANTPYEVKLKTLRDLKNQIIGNRAKKLAFMKLGAVSSVVSILSLATHGGELQEALLIQSAATIASFACGLDWGAKAVLDSGAFPLLLSLITHLNDKVADAGARALKLIYQSTTAPKYDLFLEDNIDFLLSLLSSKIENINGLAASIIAHSCQTAAEQYALSEAGVIEKLVVLLRCSLIQRDVSLESLAAMIKDNPDVASKFMGTENGRALDLVVELMKDKYPRTRLLACNCLVSIRNTSASYIQNTGTKNKLVTILLDLLDDPGQVGDEAPFVMSSLISEKEDMQKMAFDSNVIDKLCEHLKKGSFQAKRLEGIFLALAGLCSKLECCRERVLQLQVLNFVTEALAHDSSIVRAAACNFLKNVSRSVKNLSAGQFMQEPVASPLVQLLCDSNTSVQIAALGAISDAAVNAVWALKNMAFLANNRCKEEIILELTLSTLASLIRDPEASVQEQDLALVRILVDGNQNTTECMFGEDGLLLHAIGTQLRNTSKAEVPIEEMYALSNMASGNELQKEAVMNQFFPQAGNDRETILVKFLQSIDSRLRLATVWALVNLTFPSSPGACNRVTVLRNAGIGIVSLLKNMANDPCLDVKLRARTALGQFIIFGDAST